MRSSVTPEISGFEIGKALDAARWSVFRARDISTDDEVVIKLLDRAKEPVLPKRFDRQRKNLVRLVATNDGYAPVLAHGVSPSGHDYVITPYYPLGSLQDQVDQGPMPWRLAAELMAKIANVVGAAHSAELVLGDLRPSNILLEAVGKPVVAAIGMATRRFDDGTPVFTAPESQDARATLTPAADVYSLALVFGALLAGRARDRAETNEDFLAELRDLVPGRFVDVIEHGLGLSPTNRYRDAYTMEQAISAAIVADPEALVSDETEPDRDEPVDFDEILNGQNGDGFTGHGNSQDSTNGSLNGAAHHLDDDSQNGADLDEASNGSDPDHGKGQPTAAWLPPGLEDIVFASEESSLSDDAFASDDEGDPDGRLSLPAGLEDLIIVPRNGQQADPNLEDESDLDGDFAAETSIEEPIVELPDEEETINNLDELVEADVIDLDAVESPDVDLDLTTDLTIDLSTDLTIDDSDETDFDPTETVDLDLTDLEPEDLETDPEGNGEDRSGTVDPEASDGTDQETVAAPSSVATLVRQDEPTNDDDQANSLDPDANEDLEDQTTSFDLGELEDHEDYEDHEDQTTSFDLEELEDQTIALDLDELEDQTIALDLDELGDYEPGEYEEFDGEAGVDQPIDADQTIDAAQTSVGHENELEEEEADEDNSDDATTVFDLDELESALEGEGAPDTIQVPEPAEPEPTPAFAGVVFADDQTEVFDVEPLPSDDELDRLDDRERIAVPAAAMSAAPLSPYSDIAAEEIPFTGVGRARSGPETPTWVDKARDGFEVFWFRSRRSLGSSAAVLGVMAIAGVAVFVVANELQSSETEAEGTPFTPSTVTVAPLSVPSSQLSRTGATFPSDLPRTTTTRAFVAPKSTSTTAPEASSTSKAPAAPSTAAPTTDVVPTTKKPPTTKAPTTKAPTTKAPTTNAPTTKRSTTTRRVTTTKRTTTTRRVTTTRRTTTTRRVTTTAAPPTTEATTTTRRRRPTTTAEPPTTAPTTAPPTTDDTTTTSPGEVTPPPNGNVGGPGDPDAAAAAAPAPQLLSFVADSVDNNSASVSYSSNECVATSFTLTGSDGSVQQGSSPGFDPDASCANGWRLDFRGRNGLKPNTGYVLAVTIKARSTAQTNSSQISFNTSGA